MTLSETGLVLLVACGITGLILVIATPEPQIPVDGSVHAEITQLEMLESMCGDLIYGNLPRESFSGDTTVLTMDLDRSLYTVTQANLYLTRVLRRAGIEHLVTLERQEGLTFLATFENGQPLRLELRN